MKSSLVYVNQRLHIAECERVAINLWRGVPHREDWRTTREHLEHLIRRYPDGIAAFVIFPTGVLSTIGEIEGDRSEMESVTKMFMASARACATVIDIGGFVGATIRSSLTGLKLLTRSSVPTRIFAGDAEAIEWLTPLAFRSEAGPSSAQALRRTVEQVRTAADPSQNPRD